METETIKIIGTSSIQLFLGIGAWFFGWRIARAQINNQKSDIRIKLFEQRYKIYEAFREFILHCNLTEWYEVEELKKFKQNTEKYNFLFGPEIKGYYREIIANALAIRGISEGFPCEDKPVVGALVGYFKGSTKLTDLKSLQAWFIKQHQEELYKYFSPYLDYGTAGVDTENITMKPATLPEPPLIRRKISK